MAHRLRNHQDLMDARKARDAARAVAQEALKELERDTAKSQEEILARRMAAVDLKERHSAAEIKKGFAIAQRAVAAGRASRASAAAKARKASTDNGDEDKNVATRPAKFITETIDLDDTTKGARKSPAHGWESYIPTTRAQSVDGVTAPRRQFVPVAASEQMKKDLESLVERDVMPWNDVVLAPAPVPAAKKSKKVTFEFETVQPQKIRRTKPTHVYVAPDAQRPPNHITFAGSHRSETGFEPVPLYTATFDRSLGKDNVNSVRNAIAPFKMPAATTTVDMSTAPGPVISKKDEDMLMASRKLVVPASSTATTTSTANTEKQADGVSTRKNVIHSQLFGPFDITTLLDNYPGNSAAKTGKKVISSEASKPVGIAKIVTDLSLDTGKEVVSPKVIDTSDIAKLDTDFPSKHDQDFHVVSGKIPSATNGARFADADMVMDQLGEDFSPTLNGTKGWDDDGDEIDDSLEWDMGGLAEWQWVGETSAKASSKNGGN